MADSTVGPSAETLLRVRGLQVGFGRGQAPAVEGLDLDVGRGEVLGLVGESGSGKSVSMLAIMGLLDANGHMRADELRLDGQDLQALPLAERHRLLGRRVGMIFQDPQASLNPCHRIGAQLTETLALDGRRTRAGLRAAAIDLLRLVEIPDPEARLDAYPHQLSGGMCQRVMIALALARDPVLLIADEPTTALDVTIQAQIVAVLRRLQRERRLTLLLISHDLALVSSVADRVVVLYAGQAVETGPPQALFHAPQHPYTRALIQALPESARGRRRLMALPGVVPGLQDRPAGCLLAPRCPHAQPVCMQSRPMLRAAPGGGAVACHIDLPPFEGTA